MRSRRERSQAGLVTADAARRGRWGNRHASVERFLPLYEAKMLHLYDDQWATYEPDGAGGYASRLVTREEKADPDFHVMPRYWVPEHEVEHRLADWKEPWLLGWRDICRSTDERTLVASRAPRTGANHKFLLALPWLAEDAPRLQAAWSSFACDFVARQKVGGTSMGLFVVRQLPVPTADQWPRPADEIGACRAADREAAAFAAYGLDRDAVDYVLDTFPIVRRKDLAEHGEFRTKRLILEAYDQLVTASAGDERAPR